MSEREILDDYPELESEDFRAVYKFAARIGRRVIHLSEAHNKLARQVFVQQ